MHQRDLSDLLLHYNYGPATVERRGRGWDVLQNRANLPPPSIPTPAPMGPEKAWHDRSIVIQEREAAQRADKSGRGSAAAGGRRGEMLDSREERTEWDEDNVMLFFWGNTPSREHSGDGAVEARSAVIFSLTSSLRAVLLSFIGSIPNHSQLVCMARPLTK